ncbi:unnamed protein product [Lymnaea stagnalis]|uniref:Kinase n=1 Tax=Lymnaea stagnalis TaxID=6523 RepID=A0AAV2H947_LYMST
MANEETSNSNITRLTTANGPDKNQTGWKTLETQVGGHQFAHANNQTQKLAGMVDLGNGLVLKSLQNPPRGARELGFYQKVFDPECTDSDLIELREFLPAFYGTHEKCGVKYLKLANLTYGFKHPCVIDLKMGQVTYDQEASPEKIAHEISKYPPLKNLGFQITGMMVYDPVVQSVAKYDKEFSKNLTEETIVTDGLGCFFKPGNGEVRRDVIQPIVSKLLKLESWFLRQKKFSFIASSLFMVYEGSKLTDRILNSSKSKRPPIQNEDGSKVQNTSESVNRISEGQDGKNSANRGSTLQKRFNQDGILDVSRAKKPRLRDDIIGDAAEKVLPDSGKDSPGKCAQVHLIDFAHAFPATDIDKNFLFGLQKLISILQGFLK